MSNKLSLIVNFVGIDKMSGAMRNIVGLGRNGTKSIRALKGEAKKLTNGLAQVREELSKSTGNITDLINKERALENQLAETNREMDRRKRVLAINADQQAMLNRAQDFKSKGQANVLAGAAMSLPLIGATKQAMTFEAEMANVRKVVDFPTPVAFKQMSKDVLDLSTRIPMAAEGIAAIVAAGGRANIPRKELLRFAEDAAKMGVAFDITGDEAGAMMAKWRTAFSMGQTDVNRLSDQINALTNTYGGSALEVSGVVTRIGALGKVAGVTAPQVAAMAQLLNSVGVEEEIAATGIKNMMLAMTKGEAATKSQSKALKLMGLDAKQLAERMQTDASGAITDLLQKLKALPKAQQAGILTELFGSESVGAIAPMLLNLDKLQGNLALVGNQSAYAGSMQKEYLSAIATSQGASGLAMNALKALNITLGTHMLPTVMAASQKIVGMANSVRAWSEAHPELSSAIVKTLTGLVAFRIGLGAAQFALGGLLGPFAKMLPYFRKVEGISKFSRHLSLFAGGARRAGTLAMRGFSLMRTAASLLGNGIMKAAPLIMRGFGMIRMAAMFLARGVMQAGLMMMANPMVRAITIAIVVLAGAGYLIYKHWDTISAAFKSGVEWVKTSIQGLPDWLKNIGAMMMTGLLAAINPLAFAAKLISMAKIGVAAFRNQLGIKSPSRVFMGIGGHLTEGLEQGIDNGRRGPIGAIGRMATGVAAAGAMSLTPMGAAARPGTNASAGGGSSSPVTIHVYAAPGMDIPALARKVGREWERTQARTARSSFKRDR